DVSQHWPGLDCTVLNVIASDVNDLKGVSDRHATDKIVEELKRFLPFLESCTIKRSFYQPHFEQPLVMNDVGVWQFRPKGETGLENLFLAGSHCRSHVDMTSMEGASVTGLAAANAFIKCHGSGSLWDIRKPHVMSPLIYSLLRLLGLPVAAFAKLWITVRGV